ncbi:MAG: exonuclease [Flavobacteriia bacterium]|nr:exonuclease [Flavobacteriia bacterium]
MPFVIVDVETTGGSPKQSKITEIALYKYDGTSITDSYVSLINPEQSIPDFIVRLTGITDSMVKEAPKFYEIARNIMDFCEGAVFVAHNVGFDYGMLRSEFRALGYDFRMPHLCTVRASRYVIPGHASYSLGKITEALGIAIEGRHRAGGDALATAKLFEILYHKDPNHLDHFIHHEVNPQHVNPKLSMDTVDDLPEKTGVYRFYDECNRLMYIGKSKNIKKRVEQHLRNTSTAKGEIMRKEIAHIEYEITGSELIAMLLESDLIKAHKPPFNRQLRRSVFTYGLYDEPNDQGYLVLKVGLVSKHEAAPLTYFNSKKEAHEYLKNRGDAFGLCQKINGVYPSQDACFHYSVKQCSGACIGEETAEAYNVKVDQFIASLRFEDSSFFIVDKGRNRSEKSLVWIDRGKYRGYGHAPYHFNHAAPIHWTRFIEVKDEDRDNRSIINLYLRKANGFKLVNL